MPGRRGTAGTGFYFLPPTADTHNRNQVAGCAAFVGGTEEQPFRKFPETGKRDVLPDVHLHDETILVPVFRQEANAQVDRLPRRTRVNRLAFQ